MKIIETDIIKLYIDNVLNPTEEYTKNLRVLVANKTIIEKIFKLDYKDKTLAEAEERLKECYIKLEKIIEEEIKFNKFIQEEFKKTNVKFDNK